MDLSACLSFEVLWLSAKRGVVPAAICEGAAGTHPPPLFPSVSGRGECAELMAPMAALRMRPAVPGNLVRVSEYWHFLKESVGL